LSGHPLIGHYRSYCGGHRLNVAVLEALFSDPAAYSIVQEPVAATRVVRGGAMAAVAPVFSPDVH
ncbi:MAG: UDP-3-O-[3-hydroxymyristoyl] N-acetylglucosamine deacetylase, partial [Beijerinckiaceae bacterium]